MEDRIADRQPLAELLGDAVAAATCSALALFALAVIGYLVFLAVANSAPGLAQVLWHLPWDTMAILWMAGLALVKLMAIALAALALGLWVWRRRILRRATRGNDQP